MFKLRHYQMFESGEDIRQISQFGDTNRTPNRTEIKTFYQSQPMVDKIQGTGWWNATERIGIIMRERGMVI